MKIRSLTADGKNLQWRTSSSNVIYRERQKWECAEVPKESH